MIERNLLVLIFILAVAAALSVAKPFAPEMVELYPYYYNLANPDQMASRLTRNGFCCELLSDNRVIVSRDELAFALATIAKHDEATLTDPEIIQTENPHRPHALKFNDGVEHKQFLEKAISLSVGTEIVSLSLPDLEYFVAPRLPATLVLDASVKPKPETLRGIETMLKLHGATFAELRVRHVE